MTFSIIGCGRAGTFFGRLLTPHLTLNSLVSKNLESSTRVQKRLQAGKVLSHIQELASSDFYILAPADSALEECISCLATSPALHKGQTVFHVSGTYSSDILEPLRDKGLHCASLHPILNLFEDMELPSSLYATLEGDTEAKNTIRDIFSFYPVTFLPIEKENKLLYHTALLFSSQFVLALLSISKDLLTTCGLKLTEAPLIQLVQNILIHMQKKELAELVVGPIGRKNHTLLSDELSNLSSVNERYAELYRLLSDQLSQVIETT